MPLAVDTTEPEQIAAAAKRTDAKGLRAGIERGEEAIFPDPMVQQMSALWKKSPKALERVVERL